MKKVCFPIGMKDSLTLPVETVLDYFISKGFRNVLKGVFLCSDVLFKLTHCNVLLDAPPHTEQHFVRRHVTPKLF